MATGMEMMLKSLGFDPDKMREEAQKLTAMVKLIAENILALRESQVRMETKLNKILNTPGEGESSGDYTDKPIQ